MKRIYTNVYNTDEISTALGITGRITDMQVTKMHELQLTILEGSDTSPPAQPQQSARGGFNDPVAKGKVKEVIKSAFESLGTEFDDTEP